MKTFDLSIDRLLEAPWNPNQMDEAMFNRLKESLSRYGLVTPLIVRPIGDAQFEVLSGNQRLRAIRELGLIEAPCVIVKINDEEAMLLAEALNGIRGEDDLARKGTLLRKVLTNIPEDRVLSLLPETAASLKALSSIGQEDIAQHLLAWEQAQTARLSHMQLQFTRQQLDTVQEAVSLILPKAKNTQSDNPNVRGNAIFLLCKYYLERKQVE